MAGKGLQGWLLSEAARSFPASKLDPALAKAKLISNSGSASGIAYLRRGKDCLRETEKERRKKKKRSYSEEGSGM